MTDSDYQNPTLIPASTSINGALTVQANLADANRTSTVFINEGLSRHNILYDDSINRLTLAAPSSDQLLLSGNLIAMNNSIYMAGVFTNYNQLVRRGRRSPRRTRHRLPSRGHHVDLNNHNRLCGAHGYC